MGRLPTMAGFARALVPMLLIAPMAACSGPTHTDDAIPKRYVEPPQISQSAIEKYGDRAEAAYRELAQFSLEQWLVPSLLDPEHGTPSAEQLSAGITERMTSETILRWDDRVRAALGGDEEAMDDVSLLRLDTLGAPTLSLPPGGDPRVSQAITGGRVDVGQAGQNGALPLVIGFTQDADLSLREGRRDYDLSLNKTIEFTVLPAEASPAAAPGTATATSTPTVVRDPAATWLISSYDGDFSADYEGAEPTPADAAG